MSVYTMNADGLVVAIDGEPVVPVMRDPLARSLPLHRTAANYGVTCSTCDGGGCPDCTDPA